MKNSLRYLTGAAVLAVTVAIHPLAFGQVAVTQTTTSDGTISEFSPDGNTVVLHSESSTTPMRYTYSKSTTIVDESGNPVDVSVVKSGLPVQVYYDRDGDSMVARKIVVRHAVHHDDTAGAVIEHKEATTTTTTESK